MKTLFSLMLIALGSCLMQNCGCGCSEPRPPGAILFRAFYKNNSGADLLNPQTTGSYEEKDIRVISVVEKSGVQNEINLDDQGIYLDYDDDKRMNYLGVWIPTPAGYSGNPIATYVTLSPQDVDTITYTFTNSSSKYPLNPEFIYYNKQLVWELSKIKLDEHWNFTITK